MRWKRNSINALTFNLFIYLFIATKATLFYALLLPLTRTLLHLYMCVVVCVCVYFLSPVAATGCRTDSSCCCFNNLKFMTIHSRIHTYTHYGCLRTCTHTSFIIISYKQTYTLIYTHKYIYTFMYLWVYEIYHGTVSWALSLYHFFFRLHVLLIRTNAVAPLPQTPPPPPPPLHAQ